MQLLYNEFERNYSQLLGKAKKSSMAIVRLRCLCVEIYKTINRLNPAFMTEITRFKETSTKKKRFES